MTNSGNLSAEMALVFNPSDMKSSIISLNMNGITKLTSTNFITWRLQVKALLEAHELHVFISDTDQTPTETVTNADGTVAPNPSLAVWKRQDRLLYSSILGTLSLNIQPVVARATTTREIWTLLHNTYGKPSRAHVKQIKQSLKKSSKGTQSITEYMQGVMAKADQLALLGAAIEHEDLLDYITEGLSDDYKAIIEMVNGRDIPITTEELHEKLLLRENTLATTEENNNSSVPVTANTVQTRPYQRPQYRGQSSPRGGYQGRGRGYLGKCQICGVQGHSARRCPQYSSAPAQHQTHYRPGAPLLQTPQWHSPQQMAHPPWTPQAHYTAASASDMSVSPWLLDSGASHHITSDLNNLSLHAPYHGGDDVMIGNGTGLPITHTGSTKLSPSSRPLTLNNVLCVPDMRKNLISVNKLCKTNNVMVQMCPFDFQVKDLRTGETLVNGKASKGVYEWPTENSSVLNSALAFSCFKTSKSGWHSRLGHPNSQTLSHMISCFHLPVSSSSSLPCNSCFSNKIHKLPFSNTTLSSSRPLDIIFSDVWTSPIHSIDGFKYYVLFVDHFTRYTWMFPMKAKSQVAQIFPSFKMLVENRFKSKITTLYSDNGGEFVGLRSYLAQHGIAHHTSPPHTPEHNGVSERKHRHIVETGLTLLHHAGIPNTYWSYSFAAAVYLINRMTTPVLANSSPFQALFQSPPNYIKLRSFGCLCYPWIRPYGNNKFTPRSTPCVFLGYSLTQSAFLCLDVPTSRVFISRHVTFHENVFPFSSLSKISTTSDTSNISNSSNSATLVPIFSQSNAVPLEPTVAVLSSVSGISPTSTMASTSTSSLPQPTTPSPNNTHSMTTRSKNNITKPNRKYGLAAILAEIAPVNLAQALKDKRWRLSMGDEYNAIVRNRTFDLVPRHMATNIVGCMWLHRIKYNPDGTVKGLKSRLVAKGNHQRPGIDFHETFSPVIKHASIRLVLGLAVAQDWALKQLDVNNAFLQGDLDEEVYMTQPPGFIDKDRPDHVCRLRKAIYGLKQAPRAWYKALSDALISVGFVNSLADASLFVLCSGRLVIYILIYVDDIIVTGNCFPEIIKFIKHLSSRFSLKDLGDLSYFLGMEAHRTSTGLHLTQTKYITDLLAKTKMTEAKPVATPMCSTQVLTQKGGVSLSDPLTFRAIVGSLQYLCLTRPDIAFAVNRLSQFMHSPTTLHLEAAKRVLRYLAGTPHKGLFFARNTPLTLHAYSDSDWAGDHDDYTSTGAYIVYLGKQPISWSSRKMKGVARSSTEAEYRSLTAAAAEVLWITHLLKELRVSLPTMPTLFCDNIGATYLAANPVFHSRMKHLALDYHFVRELVQRKFLRVSHINTKDQLADALTKPLPRARFHDLFVKIGLSSTRPS